MLNLLIRYKPPPDSDFNAQTSKGREVGGTQQDFGEFTIDYQKLFLVPMVHAPAQTPDSIQVISE